jgi:hypothetical protein
MFRSFGRHELEETQGWEIPFCNNKFLEVLLNDEEVTMQQFNKLCINENLFSYIQIPRRRMHVEITLGGVVLTPEIGREGT